MFSGELLLEGVQFAAKVKNSKQELILFLARGVLLFAGRFRIHGVRCVRVTIVLHGVEKIDGFR